MRNLFYQGQINYARKFGKHDVTAMGVFNRTENAYGSDFSHYREDWAFRATYNYDGRYFAEYNGAYNGSEQFVLTIASTGSTQVLWAIPSARRSSSSRCASMSTCSRYATASDR